MRTLYFPAEVFGTRSTVPSFVGDCWKGFHAFRRGLTGILFDAGVDVEVAKTILRHSDSSVTRRHCLVLKSQKERKAAMKTLERVLTVGNVREHSAGGKRAKRGPEKQRV